MNRKQQSAVVSAIEAASPPDLRAWVDSHREDVGEAVAAAGRAAEPRPSLRKPRLPSNDDIARVGSAIMSAFEEMVGWYKAADAGFDMGKISDQRWAAETDYYRQPTHDKLIAWQNAMSRYIEVISTLVGRSEAVDPVDLQEMLDSLKADYTPAPRKTAPRKAAKSARLPSKSEIAQMTETIDRAMFVVDQPAMEDNGYDLGALWSGIREAEYKYRNRSTKENLERYARYVWLYIEVIRESGNYEEATEVEEQLSALMEGT